MNAKIKAALFGDAAAAECTEAGEELIRRLKNAAGGPEGIKMAYEAADAIIALKAENAELRGELTQYRDIGTPCGIKMLINKKNSALTRVEAELAAAKKAIKLAASGHCCLICGRDCVGGDVSACSAFAWDGTCNAKGGGS